MDLVGAFKRLIETNAWIAGALFVGGIFLLQLSDSFAIIAAIRRLVPGFSSNFIENSLAVSGILALVGAFASFAVWMLAAAKKQKKERRAAMQRAAQDMRWNFSDYPAGQLRQWADSVTEFRLLGAGAAGRCTGREILNVLSAEADGDSLAVFDSNFVVTNDANDSTVYSETVYLVVSERLALPYFQTQPESVIGDNRLADYLKQKSGINDLAFPERPAFSQKYIVDVSPENAARVFTPAVLDFYEQNQIYRTIGDGKMLCLIGWQTKPVDQVQITAQLQTLRHLYQLLNNG